MARNAHDYAMINTEGVTRALTQGSYPECDTVGTPGLGYPFLLCLGKGLIVIPDYVQTARPLWSGVLISRQRFRTCLTTGKDPGMTRVPEEAGSPNSRGSGPPEESGPPRKSRTPHGVPDPSWGPGPPE